MIEVRGVEREYTILSNARLKVCYKSRDLLCSA